MVTMSRRRVLAAVFSAAIMAGGPWAGLWSGAARAVETEAATSFVEGAADELLTLIKSDKTIDAKQTEFRTLIEKFVAFRDVARIALGRDWKGIDDAQRDRYVDAFLNYLSTTYARRFNEYGGEKLELLESQDAGRKGVMVKTRIAGRPGGAEPVAVDWRIMDRNGPLQLFDIYVEGVSLLITQQSEFSQFLDQNGGDVEKLISNLQARTQLALNDVK